MKEIFESSEFLQLEKLCHSKKISFILGVTKFSSCIKPKKGASYVMSDFFVEDVPDSWDRCDIRPTPPHTWLNPRPPPALSLPLSQLLHHTQQIKADFREVWNHLHGVMTETYHCPKLYLTPVPRKEVALYMDVDKLPEREFLSCVDIVHFPAFASWIKSTAVEDDSGEKLKTRVCFVGLLIHIAFKLYKLDPEIHIKSLVSVADKGANEEMNSDQAKRPSVLNGVEETKMTELLDQSSDDVQIIPKEGKTSSDVVVKTSLNTLSISKVPSTSNCSIQMVKTNPNTAETVTRSVITIEPVVPSCPSGPTGLQRSDIVVIDSAESSVINVEEEIDNFVVDLISDSDGEDGQESTNSPGDDIESNAKTELPIGEQEKTVKDSLRSDSNRKNVVSDSLGKLIQICVRLLSQDEYKVLTRKISKYLNYLPEPATQSDKLAAFIDNLTERVRDDSRNVFVYLKDIFDQMRKFRKEGFESSDSEENRQKEEKLAVEPGADDETKKKLRQENSIGEASSGRDQDRDRVFLSELNTKLFKGGESEQKTDETSETSGGIQDDKEFEAVNEKDVSEVDQKTLKEVLQSFLEICRSKFSSAKLFQPHLKSILKLMNNLDPSHVNSKPLKVFVWEHSHIEITSDNVLRHVETVSREIEKYLKSRKRPLKEVKQPAAKRVSLVTLSSSLPSSKNNSRSEHPLDDIEAEAEESSPEQRENLEAANLSHSCDGEVRCIASSSEEAEKSKKEKNVSEKHIRKLERALNRCDEEIKRLEEAEVDWDDESDQESNYVLCAKYKRRYMQLFKKIAEAKKMSKSLSRKCDKKLICSESRYPEINKKITKFLNKTRQFPDFHDIKNLVVEANADLHLTPSFVQEEAEKIFRSVGTHLKSRRQDDEAEVMMSYLKEGHHQDPAADDQELNRVLVEQVREGKKRLNDYLDNFYHSRHNENAAIDGENESEEKPTENV